MSFNQFNHPVSVSVMLYLDDVPTYVVVVKRVEWALANSTWVADQAEDPKKPSSLPVSLPSPPPF